MLFANGTLALVTALQTAGYGRRHHYPVQLCGDGSSTPVERVRPILLTLIPESMNLDRKIEAYVTPPDDGHCLAVHLHTVDRVMKNIQSIAENYGLRVIYDAAHAFAVEDDGGSLLRSRRLVCSGFPCHEGLYDV